MMVTVVDGDGTLEAQLPAGLQAGDAFEMECMARVASITSTVEELPDRVILQLYETKLKAEEGWTPPEPAPVETPLPPTGGPTPT